MAPTPSCPSQPQDRLDGNVTFSDSFDAIVIGCDEIFRVDKKLRALQEQWLEQAQFWLRSQQDAPPQGDLPQYPLAIAKIASPANTSDTSAPERFFSDYTWRSDASSRKRSPNSRQRERSQTWSEKKTNDSKNKSPESRFKDRSDTVTANDGEYQPTGSRGSSGPGHSTSIRGLKDHEERYRAQALNVTITRTSGMSERCIEKEKSYHSRVQDRVNRAAIQLTQSVQFKVFIVLAIFSNVVCVGIEVEHLAHAGNKGDIKIFEYIQLGYTIVFAVELCCRLLADGRSFFCGRRDYAWNWFDLFVVLSAIVESVANTHMNNVDITHFRLIRVLRVTRLLRTMRVLKMVRFIRALRTLVQSIAATLRHVSWSLVLLMMILYGFGVAFAQAVIDACGITSVNPLKVCESENLSIHWGTLPRSMYTLYKSISGGINWGEVTHDIGIISPVWVALFIVYLTFTLFAVLNVVTGVFCQSAIESVQEDKEMATMQLMANKGLYLEALDQLFDEIDTDGSDMITIDEFETSLEDYKVQAYFQSLEITSTDAWALFKLLDADGSGSIDRDEFLMGCIQFRGGARAVDIAKMAYENKVIYNMLEDCMCHFDEQLSAVLDALKQVVKRSGEELVRGFSEGVAGGLLSPAAFNISDFPTRQESSMSQAQSQVSNPKLPVRKPNKRQTFMRPEKEESEKGGRKNPFSRYDLELQARQGLAQIVPDRS